MNNLIVLPVLIPLITAVLMILCGQRTALRNGLSLAGALGLCVSTFWVLGATADGKILVTQLGNWPAPFGISFVADTLAGLMLAITGLLGLLVVIYSFVEVDPERQKYGFHPLYHVMLMGVCGAFLTGDMFNLFVWFEVMLMSSFALLALGGEKAQLQGTVKYLTLNFLSSGIFLTGLGILYSEVGSLNMADVAVKLRGAELTPSLTAAALLFLIAFGIKAGVFPLYSWLPASYHTPPAAVSAIFAGLLTKVGVYALIRAFTLMFTDNSTVISQIIIWVSLLTMVTGVLGAAVQFEMRRILSFHIISQIGYMTLGLGFFTKGAIAAAVFYIIHHILVKTNLFLIAGVVQRIKGSSDLKKIGGLYRDYPWLALFFLIPAMSLGGIPPLSGFFAKFALVRSGLEIADYFAVGVALFVGLLTLYSMTKIWAEGFWKADPNHDFKREIPAIPKRMFLPIVAMALVTLFISLNPQPLFQLAEQSAEQLLDPQRYIDAVSPQKYP